jgi:hypothetical protein
MVPSKEQNKESVKLGVVITIEKNFLNVGPKSSKGAKPLHMSGKNGLAEYLKMVGLLPKVE